MGQTSNDDVELLKSRIDNIEVMLENENKFIGDIEASIKRCTYQIYCKLWIVKIVISIFNVIYINVMEPMCSTCKNKFIPQFK